MTDFTLATDSGPIYKETILGRWPVEPYNTLTTLFFLALVLYWYFRVRHDRTRHALIWMCLPIVATGFVGGFVYHSFRNHIFWLLLDWVPIVIVANVISLHLWKVLLGRWDYAFLASYLPIAALVPTHALFDDSHPLASALSYSLIATSIVLPLLLFSRRMKFQRFDLIALGLVCLVSAILLRTYDRHEILSFLPMGTHFLWHTLGAAACHFLVLYLYEVLPKAKFSSGV